MNRLENLTGEERENLPKIFAQLGLLSRNHSDRPLSHYVHLLNVQFI